MNLSESLVGDKALGRQLPQLIKPLMESLLLNKIETLYKEIESYDGNLPKNSQYHKDAVIKILAMIDLCNELLSTIRENYT